MKQISSIDLYYLVKEFKILENQRIDSFYYDDETFFLKVYVKQKGNLYLTNKVSKYIYLDNEKHETNHPQNFIQYLRKYLKNSYIETIDQIESERILKLTLSKKKDNSEEFITYYMFIELFSNGNVILTDEQLNIKNSLIKKTYKDRSVKVHQKYELPPQKEITIFTLYQKHFTTLFEQTDLEIVKFLATKLGMGGKFSEEICAQAQIDKNKKQLTDDEIKILIKKLEELKDKQIKPYAIIKDDEIKDFIPFEFVSITDTRNQKISGQSETSSDSEKKEYQSYNQLIKDYFLQFKQEKDKNNEILEKELKKLKNRLKTQEESLIRTHKEYEKQNEIGNKIYEHYSVIEELLESINKSGKEKGWEHVQKTIKENEQLSKLVKKLNYKNNEIILNLD